MPTLEDRLLDYDGKTTSILSEAQSDCRRQPDFLDNVVKLCLDPNPLVSQGATWILKAELDAGTRLSQRHRADIVAALGSIANWQAALHLLQSVERLDLDARQGALFVDWAREYTHHSRPFLRAWSLHAIVALDIGMPELRCASAAALSMAERDPAASVRARARNLRRAFETAKHRAEGASTARLPP